LFQISRGHENAIGVDRNDGEAFDVAAEVKKSFFRDPFATGTCLLFALTPRTPCDGSWAPEFGWLNFLSFRQGPDESAWLSSDFTESFGQLFVFGFLDEWGEGRWQEKRRMGYINETGRGGGRRTLPNWRRNSVFFWWRRRPVGVKACLRRPSGFSVSRVVCRDGGTATWAG